MGGITISLSYDGRKPDSSYITMEHDLLRNDAYMPFITEVTITYIYRYIGHTLYLTNNPMPLIVGHLPIHGTIPWGC
jgi:hypothetical protein